MRTTSSDARQRSLSARYNERPAQTQVVNQPATVKMSRNCMETTPNRSAQIISLKLTLKNSLFHFWLQCEVCWTKKRTANLSTCRVYFKVKGRQKGRNWYLCTTLNRRLYQLEFSGLVWPEWLLTLLTETGNKTYLMFLKLSLRLRRNKLYELSSLSKANRSIAQLFCYTADLPELQPIIDYPSTSPVSSYFNSN